MAILRIYKITNSIDDYVYIGITSKLLNNKLDEYLANAKKGIFSNLYEHIRKIGAEKFTIHLIEEVNYLYPCEMRINAEKKFDPKFLLNNNICEKPPTKVEEVKKKTIESKPKVEEVKKRRGICFSIKWQ
jgi:L-rhamnose mutarotase